MTPPVQPVPDPRILANLQRLKDAGAPDTALEAYLAEESGKPATPAVPASPDKATLARRAAARTRQNANDQEMAAAETPDYATQVTGGIASLAKDIPGAEALQAAIRSASSRPSPEVVAAMAQHPLRSSGADTPQTYREARSDIQNAEADAPAFVRGFNRTAGNVVGASSIPGLSPWKAGGLYGVASGLMQSDPDAGIGHRSADAAIKGVLGAAGAKVADAGTGWLRSVFAKTIGSNALSRTAATRAMDTANYGQAAAEGAAAGGTSPAIKAALEQPDIAPYAETIRTSRLHAGADDATVLREAYKLMSERQGTLANRVVNATDFKAGTSLEKADVGLAKQEMLRAAETPTVTDSRAVTTAQSPHPGLRDALDAFRTKAGEAARRATGGSTPNANPFSSRASGETVAQRSAREMLERHGAASSVTPPITGTPPKEVLPAAMPSLRPAVEQHAEQAGLRDAFNTGADATQRIVKGVHVKAKKLDTNSPEAFAEAIKKMKEEAANASLEGVLGRLKENNHLSANPFKLFGAGPGMANASKMAPYIHALDEIAQQARPSGWARLRPLPGVPADAARNSLVALLTRIGLPAASQPTQ